MGALLYGAHEYSVAIQDRVLAHLEIVMLAKLRRNESFSFSWRSDEAEGSAHVTLWFAPAIPLRFEYTGSAGHINRAWLEAMSADSFGSRGLRIVDEPVPSLVLVTAARQRNVTPAIP